MKRQPSGSRSFLRQLAEPMSSAVAPLIPRKPTGTRGSAAMSAIPPILDVREPGDVAEPVVERDMIQPGVAGKSGNTIPAKQQNVSSPKADAITSQVHRQAASEHHSVEAATGSKSAPRVNIDPTKREAKMADAILQSTRHEPRIMQAAISATAVSAPRLESVDASATRAAASRSASTQSDANAPAPDRRPGISIRIGTIEVRVPPPPAHVPQPAPAALNPRSAQHSVRSRAVEPLSRGLAWNHGLVQG